MERYLLDSNTVINYLEASLPNEGIKLLNLKIDTEPIISVITKIETLGYNFSSKEDYDIMEMFIGGSKILDLNDSIARIAINIRKTKKIKLPDAVIAATAVNYNLTLITRNVADFKNINGLQLLDPFNIPLFKS